MKNRIRIVHVITGLRRGGAETMLTKLVEAMNSRLFDQSVLVLGDCGDLGPQIQRAGIRVIPLDMKGALDLPRALLKLRAILKDTNPQIVQTWLYHADFVGTLGAKVFGRDLRLLWNIRCSNMNFHDYGLATRLICVLLARMSAVPDLVISNSLTGKRAHIELGYHPRDWRIIPNGFDTERFKPDAGRSVEFRRSLCVGADVPLVGLPARLDPMKDHENFLAAAAILVRKHPAAQLVLIGRGFSLDNAELGRSISRCGLENFIHLLGDRDDMETVLAGLDIVTLSSAYGEGFPNVLGEAMSCGKICVATDVGDSAAIIGQCGYVVPPREPAALANAWSEIIAMEPAERIELGLLARQRVVDNYSLAVVAQAYEGLYASIAFE